MKKLKFSNDIHGVIDDLPEAFVAINNALFDAGHEIHIITGSRKTESIINALAKLGIKYHYFFSISDYCKQTGIEVTDDSKGDPWVDEETWNKTKGDYCAKVGIDLHFDDSDVYHKYFTTPYARVFTKNNKGGDKKVIIR